MFLEGTKVGPYVLKKQIGKGGFGEVWLAEKRSRIVTKLVAIKLPHDDQIDIDEIRKEATLWEKASGHPNVLPIIDADIYDGQVVIVGEYASGGSLFDKLKREKKLSFKESVKMTVGILRGLSFLHSKLIIHRDIKPQNILLQDDIPRLADFGISRAMNADTVSLVVIGTDSYMAPEAFDGIRNAQTDIWSVGVVLYEMLRGEKPFPQKHPTERMFAILTKDFEPLSKKVPGILREIVSKSLTKEPEKRYQTANQMQEDLQKTLIHLHDPLEAPTQFISKDTSEELFETIDAQEEEEAITSGKTEEKEEEDSLTQQKTIEKTAATEIAPTQPSYPTESILTQVKNIPEQVTVVNKVSDSDKNKQIPKTNFLQRDISVNDSFGTFWEGKHMVFTVSSALFLFVLVYMWLQNIDLVTAFLLSLFFLLFFGAVGFIVYSVFYPKH